MSDDVMVLNNGYLEQRTSKTGKQRFTLVVKSEPVVFNVNPKSLGRPIAAAIVHHLQERVRGISDVASKSRLRARKAAAKAYAAGKPWAQKLYAGGRIGAMPPNQSDRAFNDSGRFAKSISGSASSDGAWRVNVAANRLDPTTGNIDRIYRRLVELVPEFANPALLLENAVLKRAIENTTRGMIKKMNEQTGALRIEALRSLFDLVENVADIIG